MGSYDQWLTTDPNADAPEWCEVCCTADLDRCVCPECPTCGSAGEPACYEGWEEVDLCVGRWHQACGALTVPHVVLARQAWWEWRCAEDAREEAAWAAEGGREWEDLLEAEDG